uniref:Sema domain-containing protein n=1 Tax=Magallana gigas TaxID=29159 RepID=A0A8W8LTQ5_MAGGI
MEIDLEAKVVYVSGKNILYRLSVQEDMQMIKRQTGPVVNCLPQLPPETLKHEYCGDDYNTVMVVTPDSLITCGTLRGGLCMRRDKESLNITMTSLSNCLVSNEQASALGIFLNITDKSSPGLFQNIVLLAKEYTTLPLSAANLEEAAIFSVLPDLSVISLDNSKYGRIFDMILKDTVNVKMDYRVVFENDKFVFFLVNQNSQSKLVKICKSIDSEARYSKKVYEDIPVSCNAGEINLTHVKHGIFISVSGKRYLIVLFSRSKPTRSAVCVFEENDIYEAFLKSRRHRLGCPKSDLPADDVIFQADRGSPQVCIEYRNLNKTNEPLIGVYDAFYKGDYCNSVNMVSQFGIIVGLLPLEGNAVYSTKSHQVTVVGSLTINNLTTLYIGTDNGSVIQVLYDKEKNRSSVLSEIKVDPSEIRAIRSLNGETYIMSQNKIVKLLPSKNCGQYSGNCQQCMDVNDFDCGWCVTKGV